MDLVPSRAIFFINVFILLIRLHLRSSTKEIFAWCLALEGCFQILKSLSDLGRTLPVVTGSYPSVIQVDEDDGRKDC